MENQSTYRIRTEVGSDKPINIPISLMQEYNSFEILSLKINTDETYRFYTSPTGIVIGRVSTANNGLGVPNVRVSIFVPKGQYEQSDEEAVMYPFSSPTDLNGDRVRYNLLPSDSDVDCYQVIGTMPTKRKILDNETVCEVFEKFYKYTTVTNEAGDFMLSGIPVGKQRIHIDADLSDIGPFLSQKPYDMIENLGFETSKFESTRQFKSSTDLDSLAQVISQNKSVYVYPYWGEATEHNTEMKITRTDLSLNYEFNTSAVFIGSVITDKQSNSIRSNCTATEHAGKMSDMVTGPGRIEMIRKTVDGKIEQYRVKGDELINDNGVWCYQVPMNLDYVRTDEFGNIIPTDDPNKGVPTRARVRFRVTLNEMSSDNDAHKRSSYLIPNNPKISDTRFLTENDADYSFGSETWDESFVDLFWNKVYTVKNFVPRIQKTTRATNRKHTGIKMVNHYGDNNPFPYNSMTIKLPFQYRLICVIVELFIQLVRLLNVIISIIGALPCWLYTRKILGVRPFRFALNFVPSCISLGSEFCDDGINKYKTYPGCDGCVWDSKTKPECAKSQYKAAQVDGESAVCTRNDSKIINCVENQLAQSNEATSFNFCNDWINGCLYMPLWNRRIKPKKSFFFGLFKRRAKDEWCAGEKNEGGRSLKLTSFCVHTNSGKFKTKDYNGENVTYHYTKNNDNCGYKCHEKRQWVNLTNGVIINRDNMFGQKVWYYKAVEVNTSLTSGIANEYFNSDLKPQVIKTLFATDIVMLGSMNDCDLNGIPKFFNYLKASTYNMPTDILFTDTEIEYTLNSNGEVVNQNAEEISVSSGCDWGNRNEYGYYDGGLFYSIGCNSIQVNTPSCINLKRICEIGVGQDEMKYIENLEKARIESETDELDYNKTEYFLRPDGYVSYDDIIDFDYRSMFATMNGNGLKTKINKINGVREYDFRHLYIDNFDGSLRSLMQNGLSEKTKANYQYNYKLETTSADYLTFRMGDRPYYYDGESLVGKDSNLGPKEFKLPKYQNSFYFYFGLKEGKTAIDLFNQKYNGPCATKIEENEVLDYEVSANSWCNFDDEGEIYIDLNFYIENYTVIHDFIYRKYYKKDDEIDTDIFTKSEIDEFIKKGVVSKDDNKVLVASIFEKTYKEGDIINPIAFATEDIEDFVNKGYITSSFGVEKNKEFTYSKDFIKDNIIYAILLTELYGEDDIKNLINDGYISEFYMVLKDFKYNETISYKKNDELTGEVFVNDDEIEALIGKGNILRVYKILKNFTYEKTYKEDDIIKSVLFNEIYNDEDNKYLIDKGYIKASHKILKTFNITINNTLTLYKEGEVISHTAYYALISNGKMVREYNHANFNGYLKINFDDIPLPCTAMLNSKNNSSISYTIISNYDGDTNITAEKIYFTGDEYSETDIFKGYTRYYFRYEDSLRDIDVTPCLMINNGDYTMYVIDGDGNQHVYDIKIEGEYLTFDNVENNFKKDNNTLSTLYKASSSYGAESPYCSVARVPETNSFNVMFDEDGIPSVERVDKEKNEKYKVDKSKEIKLNGTICIYNLLDRGSNLTNFIIEIESYDNDGELSWYHPKMYTIDGSTFYLCSVDEEGVIMSSWMEASYLYYTNATVSDENNLKIPCYIIKCPKGDVNYKVIITQVCHENIVKSNVCNICSYTGEMDKDGDGNDICPICGNNDIEHDVSVDVFKKTQNAVERVIYVGEPTPYKLYINDVDYDIIKNFKTGWELSTVRNMQTTGEINHPKPFSGVGNVVNIKGWLNISDVNNEYYDWSVDIKKYGTHDDDKDFVINENTGKYTIIENLEKLETIEPREEVYMSEWQTKHDEWELFEPKITGYDTEEEYQKAHDAWEAIEPREEVYMSEWQTKYDEWLVKYVSISEKTELLQNRLEFISSMKNAFWLQSEEEEKTITYNVTTDENPYDVWTLYNTEEASSTDDTYNETKSDTNGRKRRRDLWVYSGENAMTIGGIKIPNITYIKSTDFGIDSVREKKHKTTYNISTGICYAQDNIAEKSTSTGSISIKPPYIVACVNGDGITKPSGMKINNFFYKSDANQYGISSYKFGDGGNNKGYIKNGDVEFFQYVIIDKIFKADIISWAYMGNIPYFLSDEVYQNTFDIKGYYIDNKDSDKRLGNVIRTYGILTGNINNGISNSQGYVDDFETSTIFDKDVIIKTYAKDGEDSIPTRRFITYSPYYTVVFNENGAFSISEYTSVAANVGDNYKLTKSFCLPALIEYHIYSLGENGFDENEEIVMEEPIGDDIEKIKSNVSYIYSDDNTKIAQFDADGKIDYFQTTEDDTTPIKITKSKVYLSVVKYYVYNYNDRTNNILMDDEPVSASSVKGLKIIISGEVYSNEIIVEDALIYKNYWHVNDFEKNQYQLVPNMEGEINFVDNGGYASINKTVYGSMKINVAASTVANFTRYFVGDDYTSDYSDTEYLENNESSVTLKVNVSNIDTEEDEVTFYIYTLKDTKYPLNYFNITDIEYDADDNNINCYYSIESVSLEKYQLWRLCIPKENGYDTEEEYQKAYDAWKSIEPTKEDYGDDYDKYHKKWILCEPQKEKYESKEKWQEAFLAWYDLKPELFGNAWYEDGTYYPTQLFHHNTTSEVLQSCVYKTVKSQISYENEDGNTTVETKNGYGTTGVFTNLPVNLHFNTNIGADKQFFVIAESKSGCRAISPVYDFNIIHYVIGCVEKTDGEETSYYLRIKLNDVLGEDNKPNNYYLTQFSYDVEFTFGEDTDYVVDFNMTVNKKENINHFETYIEYGITEKCYNELGKLNYGFVQGSKEQQMYNNGKKVYFYITDITGLKHRCLIDDYITDIDYWNDYTKYEEE